MTVTLAKTTEAFPVRLILTLLIGQAFFLGVATVLVYVASNTLFLVDYGAEFLPYIYIITGIFASLVFFGLAALQRRWSLAQLTSAILIGQALIFLASRLALTLPNARWVSIFLMVFYPLGYQLSTLTFGGQAGRLLDVRQMKRLFPIVFAGFVAGFVITALSVPFLVSLLGSTNNLLLLSSGSLLIAFAIFGVTLFQFPNQLRQQASGKTNNPTKSPGQLLRNRYIFKLLSYQMLSAFGTQLVVYIFLVQADARFTSETELANFFGAFAGVRNIINLLILLFVAGLLISRFGLGFGLSANPIAVGVMVAVMAIGAMVAAPVGPVLFWLAISTFVLDMVLSDGITSTAIKATYQSLPAEDQSTVETVVEGIGVPTALGITGVLILILNAIPGLTLTHTIFFTFIITLGWTALAFLVYRDYAGALLHTLSRRALGAVDFFLDDSSSLAVVQNLLQSPKLNEVRLALDLLERAEHETLGPSLITLADHPQAEIRADALARIARLQVQAALPVVEQHLETETDPAAKGAALRALCALTEAEAVDLVPDEYLDDPEPEIRLGAMAGLLRYGGISGVLEAGLPLTFLVDDVEPEQRAFAAQVIGEVGQHGFYRPLLSLLADEDRQVRLAALTAAGQVKHARLLPLVIDNLADPKTRAEAMAALVAGGEVVLPFVGQALAGAEAQYDQDTVRRLVRVCGQIKGERVIDLLKQYLDHPNAEIQYQILFSLNLCGYRAGPDDERHLEQALRTLAEHGGRVILTRQDIGEAEALAPLHAALDHEFSHIRRRIFLLLSFIYEPRAMLRAEERLGRGSRSEKALAIETLDVTLSNEQKGMILPLIDDSLAPAQRVQSLGPQVALTQLGREQRLKEMIMDTQVWGQEWTRACAIYACGQLSLNELAEAVESTLSLTDAVVQETAAWALQTLNPERYQTQVTALATEDNP